MTREEEDAILGPSVLQWIGEPSLSKVRLRLREAIRKAEEDAYRRGWDAAVLSHPAKGRR